jgi:hypothetical protein
LTPAWPEKLDSLLVQAAFFAGKQCRSRRRDWWSLALTKQRTKTNILRCLLSGYKNNIDMKPALEARLLRLKLTMELPPTIQLCNVALRLGQLKTQELLTAKPTSVTPTLTRTLKSMP